VPVLLLARQNRICLKKAARSQTGFLLCSRELGGFFVSLLGHLLYSQKTEAYFSAFLSTILATTQENVDELLNTDHGIKLSI